MNERILLVTDSEGLPRPTIGLALEDTYLHQLEKHSALWLVSLGGGWISQITDQALNITSYLPDMTFEAGIVQLGIVDCAPRPIPYAYHQAIGKLPWPVKATAIKILHHFRPVIIKGIGYTQYTPIDQFTLHYARLLKGLSRVCRQIIVIGIAPVSPEVARHSPHLDEQIAIYNREIQRMVLPTTVFLDLASFGADASKFLTPDGHITAPAHAELWERMLPYICHQQNWPQ